MKKTGFLTSFFRVVEEALRKKRKDHDDRSKTSQLFFLTFFYSKLQITFSLEYGFLIIAQGHQSLNAKNGHSEGLAVSSIKDEVAMNCT